MKRRVIFVTAILAVLAVVGCGIFVKIEPQDKIFRSAAPVNGITPDGFTDVGGVKYHYLHVPGNGETVVLIHGFGSSTYTWEGVLPYMAREGLNLYAVDMMGFGWSDKPKGAAYDPASLMEGVNAWMDKMGISRATVVGNSLGGEVSLLLAGRHPDKVARLVLIDPRVYLKTRPFIVRLAAMPGAGFLSRLVFGKGMVRDNIEAVFYNDSLITEDRVQSYYDRLRSEGALAATTAIARSTGKQPTAEVEGLPPKITAPTLVVWGADDAWIPVEHAYRLKKEIPNARLFIIEQCGHVPQEEKPQVTAKVLADFVLGRPIAETPVLDR